ncbi:hypothetical protein FF011L_19270 [Roseimaritima multifibrata]|uniref:Uncharacterized protein n=1 Tax=Roseimaritima multifibrata TaxID=1930274 RepID=A0A517ME56_9BACT|nr:hypothetical protein FF011L_19270 [Roseimaritima multifibrata]
MGPFLPATLTTYSLLIYHTSLKNCEVNFFLVACQTVNSLLIEDGPVTLHVAICYSLLLAQTSTAEFSPGGRVSVYLSR